MAVDRKKITRRLLIAVPLFVVLFYFLPVVMSVLVVCGLVDVMRNKARTVLMFNRYFLGNGISTWLLSPFNLLVDLISYRNPGVYTLDDFPPEYRREIEEVLDTFRNRKDEIIATVDRSFSAGKRGMYVYRWFGKQHATDVPEFNREFKYVKTIAVSVFSGKQWTTWHFGPLRLSVRVLLNLNPVVSDQVYIECNGARHYWHEIRSTFSTTPCFTHRSIWWKTGATMSSWMSCGRRRSRA